MEVRQLDGFVLLARLAFLRARMAAERSRANPNDLVLRSAAHFAAADAAAATNLLGVTPDDVVRDMETKIRAVKDGFVEAVAKAGLVEDEIGDSSNTDLSDPLPAEYFDAHKVFIEAGNRVEAIQQRHEAAPDDSAIRKELVNALAIASDAGDRLASILRLRQEKRISTGDKDRSNKDSRKEEG